MRAFNLIVEAWIPVRYDNGQVGEVGIREVLLRATEIAAIEDASPLVVAALHRLLLAVLYRALQGPTDIDQALDLYETGLPLSKITTYLDKWLDRFWLFDDTHPFWQVAEFEPTEWKPWTVLAAEHNRDNNKVLFDHTDNTRASSAPAGRVARYLAATQTFALGGGRSEFSYAAGAPSATSLMVLPEGVTLQESLLLALVPESRDVLLTDLPVWERQPDTPEELRAGPSRVASGRADLYTWRSRSVRLCAGEGTGEVVGAGFASGMRYEPSMLADPMCGHRVDPEHGLLPAQLRDRGIWREFDSLLPDSEALAPAVIAHAAALRRNTRRRGRLTVLALGQCTDRAKLLFWRQERFVLPAQLGSEGATRRQVRSLLEGAAAMEGCLRDACRRFARHVISRGERDVAARDVTSFTNAMTVVPAFWSRLEREFHEVLGSLQVGREDDTIASRWSAAVNSAARDAWDAHVSAIDIGNPWILRAILKAEPALARCVGKLGASQPAK